MLSDPKFPFQSTGEGIRSASCTWTPAASSHTAGDSVGGAKTLTLPQMADRMIKIVGYTFSMDTTTPVTSVYTVHLYNSTPAVIADDSPYAVVTADGSKYQGIQAIAQPVDYTSTWQHIEAWGLSKSVQMADTDVLTAYLVNGTTGTYEAVAHKLTLFYEAQL